SEMGTATITLTALSPVDTADAALTNLRALRTSGPGWQESSSESIEVCGRRGLRISGIDRTAGLELHRDHLEFPYESAGSMYPIQVSSQLKAVDTGRYLADIRTIFDGVRIVP